MCFVLIVVARLRHRPLVVQQGTMPLILAASACDSGGKRQRLGARAAAFVDPGAGRAASPVPMPPLPNRISASRRVTGLARLDVNQAIPDPAARRTNRPTRLPDHRRLCRSGSHLKGPRVLRAWPASRPRLRGRFRGPGSAERRARRGPP